MDKVKQFFAGINPTVKICLLIVSAYLIYKKIRQTSQLKSLNDTTISGSGPGIPSGGSASGGSSAGGGVVGSIPTTLNILTVLEAVWYECFDTAWLEDETKIIKLIKSVPINRMRELALAWNKKVIMDGGKYKWYLGGPWHSPAGFIEDMNYYLDTRVNEIAAQLNAV